MVYSQRGIIAAVPVKTAARALLESLVGQPISTVTGRPNTVLRVESDSVIVATSRSPTGQPVPIKWVQSGLEQLLETGEIEVSVPSLGHRSSFVSAVLLTLPSAVLIRTSPPHIRLNQSPVPSAAGGLRDVSSWVLARWPPQRGASGRGVAGPRAGAAVRVRARLSARGSGGRGGLYAGCSPMGGAAGWLGRPAG